MSEPAVPPTDVVRGDPQLIAARRELETAQHAESGLLDARFGFRPQVGRQVVGGSAARLALRVEGVVRHLDLAVLGQTEILADHFDADEHRRLRGGALERRREHAHADAADLNRDCSAPP